MWICEGFFTHRNFCLKYICCFFATCVKKNMYVSQYQGPGSNAFKVQLSCTTCIY